MDRVAPRANRPRRGRGPDLLRSGLPGRPIRPVTDRCGSSAPGWSTQDDGVALLLSGPCEAHERGDGANPRDEIARDEAVIDAEDDVQTTPGRCRPAPVKISDNSHQFLFKRLRDPTLVAGRRRIAQGRRGMGRADEALPGDWLARQHALATSSTVSKFPSEYRMPSCLTCARHAFVRVSPCPFL